MYNPWKILAVSARVRRLHGYGTGAAGRKMRRSPNNILSSDAFTWVILVILCLTHPWKDTGKAGDKKLEPRFESFGWWKDRAAVNELGVAYPTTIYFWGRPQH